MPPYKKPRKPIWDPADGLPPTEEQVEKMKKQALNVANYWIAQQELHSGDLRKKWERKKLPADITDPILQRLKDEGLINDDRYIQLFISSALQSRKGVQVIRQKLIMKGVPREEVDDALATYVDEEQVEENIHVLARRKAERAVKLEERKRLPHIVGFLARRGYPAGQAFQVAKEALQEVLDEQVEDEWDSEEEL